MTGKWRTSTWGDEIILEYGKALRGHSGSAGPYRVFGSNGPIGWTSEQLAPGPGVILGRKGAYRGVHYSPDPFFVIDTAYYVVPKNELDMRWLLYAIKHYKLGEIDDGSPIPSTTRAAVYIQDFEVPPLVEQRAIARILGALDDKIELNRQMNETLEAMARALFKSWFVDFDPVHAKSEGRDTGLPKSVANLFPDSYEDSELGEIPKEWDVKPLIQLTSYLSRGIGPSYIEDGGICVLNQKCIRGGRIDFSKARRHDGAKKSIKGRRLRPLDILVNSTGVGTLGRLAQLHGFPEDLIVDSHITIVRTSASINPRFLGCTLLSRETEVEGLGEGTTGQTELSRARLGALPCVVPPEDLQDIFGRLVEPLYSRLAVNEYEAETLAALRDALLPKLISGEIRVKDAERIVQRVA
jgi:type I restriction enzyme S subunit